MKISLIHVKEKQRQIHSKNILSLFLALSICIATIICWKNLAPDQEKSISVISNSSTASDTLPTIVIDAGHGGRDGGAVGYDNVPEKTYNLKMAKQLQVFCQMAGLQTVMTRTEDQDTDGKDNGFYKATDIKNRIALAEKQKNPIFISIHLNSSDSKNNQGFQVFYGLKNEKSQLLANAMHQAVEQSNLSTRVRDVKSAPQSVYIQKNIKIPSILAECAFIKNGEDYRLIKDPAYEQKLMFTFLKGISEYIHTNLKQEK